MTCYVHCHGASYISSNEYLDRLDINKNIVFSFYDHLTVYTPYYTDSYGASFIASDEYLDCIRIYNYN